MTAHAVANTATTTSPGRRRGRPCHLTHYDRARAIAAIFGVSQPTAHRAIRAELPAIAGLFQPAAPGRDDVLILDGTMIPVPDQAPTRPPKNYRRSVNVQVTATPGRKVVLVSDAWPANRNDITVARATVTIPPGVIVLTDGGYRSLPGAVLPPRQSPALLIIHKRIRAETEHLLARFKDWQTLRQCRRHGNSTNLAVRAVAYLRNLKLATSSQSWTDYESTLSGRPENDRSRFRARPLRLIPPRAP